MIKLLEYKNMTVIFKRVKRSDVVHPPNQDTTMEVTHTLEMIRNTMTNDTRGMSLFAPIPLPEGTTHLPQLLVTRKS
jgi:hypothetical protein